MQSSKSKSFFFILFFGIAYLFIFLQFRSIEAFAFNSGFSWSTARMYPLFLIGTCAIALSLFIIITLQSYVLKNLSVFLRVLLTFIGSTIFVALVFIKYPIYEGDFSNDFEPNNTPMILDGLAKKQFAVITTPGCPFCHAAMADIKTMKERNQDLKISVIIVSPNSADTVEYRKILPKDISILVSEDFSYFDKVTHSSYPTWMEINDNSISKVWNNNQVGYKVKDYIEQTKY